LKAIFGKRSDLMHGCMAMLQRSLSAAIAMLGTLVSLAGVIAVCAAAIRMHLAAVLRLPRALCVFNCLVSSRFVTKPLVPAKVAAT
jgi:hypothetical protein